MPPKKGRSAPSRGLARKAVEDDGLDKPMDGVYKAAFGSGSAEVAGEVKVIEEGDQEMKDEEAVS